jgi:hypothetical protein
MSTSFRIGVRRDCGGGIERHVGIGCRCGRLAGFRSQMDQVPHSLAPTRSLSIAPDTLRLYRTDTVTVRRVDTVRTQPPPPCPAPEILRQIGGFYFGADIGAALATGDFDNGQTGRATF